jgi:hypothetical protein
MKQGAQIVGAPEVSTQRTRMMIPDRDVYVCPAGEMLSPNHEGKLRDLKKIDYSKPRWARSKSARIKVALHYEAVLDNG